MSETIVRFPVKSWQRIRNKRGKKSISCMVTDRWLRFEKEAKKVDFGNGKFETAVFVKMMTDVSGDPHRICELCITLEEMRSVLRTYEK